MNKHLEELIFEELRTASKGSIGGFLPAVKQVMSKCVHTQSMFASDC